MTDPQQFLICKSEESATGANVMLDAETLWPSQKQSTKLFGMPVISMDLRIPDTFTDCLAIEWQPL